MTTNKEIMPNELEPHTVAILVFDDVVMADATIAAEAFARVRLRCGTSPYRVKICAAHKTISTQFFDLEVPHTFASLRSASTIIVPGLTTLDTQPCPKLLNALRGAKHRGARIASICTGAFILAATGLLDGLRATTHWSVASKLAEDYPALDVDEDVLYVDNGKLLTSAGAISGMDLCLHIIRKDFGATVAANTARMCVMAPERSGGQRQFIRREMPKANNASLQPLLEWVEKNLRNDLSINELSTKAFVSPRTLHRRFMEQIGIPPATWVLQCRVRYAQTLLESTKLSIDQIAEDVGFGSSANFRDQFGRQIGINPSTYRRSFANASIT